MDVLRTGVEIVAQDVSQDDNVYVRPKLTMLVRRDANGAQSEEGFDR